MATLNVSSQDIREELEDRLEVLNDLAEAEAQRVFNANRAALFEAEEVTWTETRDEIGTRLRRGAVRERPSLDGVLEAQLTDIAIERDESGDIIKIYTNDDAASFRESI